MHAWGARLQELSVLAAALWLRVHSGGRWPKSRCSASSGTVSRCTSVPIHSGAFDLAVKLSSSQIKLNDVAVKQFLRLWVKCSFFFFLFFLNSFSCLSALAVEQLLSLGRSLPHPGVTAAGELLERQESQDLPQVSAGGAASQAAGRAGCTLSPWYFFNKCCLSDAVWLLVCMQTELELLENSF